MYVRALLGEGDGWADGSSSRRSAKPLKFTDLNVDVVEMVVKALIGQPSLARARLQGQLGDP
jgi:hypothetical protein